MGIGRAYACELAKEGLNIMLISNDPDSLTQTAEEIEATYGVKTKAILGDFTEPDLIEKLRPEIEQLPSVACLVNNVGMFCPLREAAISGGLISLEFIQKIIKCNMASGTNMSHLVAPILLRQNRPNAAIINISSQSAFMPLPYISLYGASKAYISHFSLALEEELRGRGIIVQTVYPAIVATRLSGITRASFVIPDPETFVKSALDLLGVENRTAGYIGHALQRLITLKLPDFMTKLRIQKKLKKELSLNR
ncbi:unnamed protein product [Calicophoron daubneyi]|uniref:Short-chain dehydrogenase n=1 Tax=Calicophoron daubneyi TaxID=300641 RepID=A0AAV2TFB8_CALDB